MRHDSSYPETEPTPCQVFPGPPDVEVEGVPVFLDPPSRHRIHGTRRRAWLEVSLGPVAAPASLGAPHTHAQRMLGIEI